MVCGTVVPEMISGNSNSNPIIEYCLYARKSSEDDERQAMSIDSQIKEMNDMAVREGLFIKEIRKESHSAKQSGQRPVFMQIIRDLRVGLFTGILTWAPDRLSRNAGDLGQLVDLMDLGKLIHIKTFTQAFSNTPSEKFLLMILCSQAKLENDQKGINVKRGIRAKCEMGWRPGPPPIGYFNRSFNGVKEIVVDPDRAPIVTKMFHRVDQNGESGRTIRKWFDLIHFTTRSGKPMPLSLIYLMLKNPFYYGRFEYPINSGMWYQGSHKPLVTKELFDRIQARLKTVPKAKWGSKKFTFQKMLNCGTCSGILVAEEKNRSRKYRDPNYHVYYHCSRPYSRPCDESYISEMQIINQLRSYINLLKPETTHMTDKFKFGLKDFERMRNEILLVQDIDPTLHPITFREYAMFILQEGSISEKRELVRTLAPQFYIHNRKLCTSNKG